MLQLKLRDNQQLTTVQGGSVESQEQFGKTRISTRQTELEARTTQVSESRDVLVSETPYSSHLTDIHTITVRDEQIALSLFQGLIEQGNGAKLSELIFRLERMSSEHTSTNVTTVDLIELGSLVGLALGQSSSESYRVSSQVVEGHILVDTPPPRDLLADAIANIKAKLGKVDLSKAFDAVNQLLKKHIAPTTQDVLARIDDAKANGSQALKDAYGSLNNILRTQKKGAWANALYTELSGYLKGDRTSAFQRNLAKLAEESPSKLLQFITDAKVVLANTKNFDKHAAALGRLQADNGIQQAAA